MRRLTQKAASPVISTSDGPLSPAGLSQRAAHRQARLCRGGHTPAPRGQGHLSLRLPPARSLGRRQEPPGEGLASPPLVLLLSAGGLSLQHPWLWAVSLQLSSCTVPLSELGARL